MTSAAAFAAHDRGKPVITINRNRLADARSPKANGADRRECACAAEGFDHAPYLLTSREYEHVRRAELGLRRDQGGALRLVVQPSFSWLSRLLTPFSRQQGTIGSAG
jgi:hypothetical protein